MHSGSSWSPPSPRDRNLSTEHFAAFSGVHPVAAAPPAFEAAYALAISTDRARGPMRAPGHRLYWMSKASFGSIDLVAGAKAFAVIGRHTHCDVTLHGDTLISLRHVLVRTALLDDGCPMLSMLDLRTPLGIELPDRTSRAIAATGPLVARIGSYVVVALPSGEPAPPSLPPSVCTEASSHPYRSPAGRRLGQSMLTMLPEPIELSMRGGLAPSQSRYEIVLASRAARARVFVSGEDLDRGVLVGRAERCVDDGLRSLLNLGISRVHVILLRTREGVVAYDAASVQGTYDFLGRRLRATRLGDDGAAIALGSGAVEVRLYLQPA